MPRLRSQIPPRPRDALLTDAVPADQRGAAFGVQRAMDNAGAVLGSLIAWALLPWVTQDFRVRFWIATVPLPAALLALTLGVQEQPPAEPQASLVPQASPPAEPIGGSQLPLPSPPATPAPPAQNAAAPFVMQPRCKDYLALLFRFTLGNSSDAFLLLRAQSPGVSIVQLPLLWALLNRIKAVGVRPAGKLRDKLGRRPLIAAGWLVYALVYRGFAAAGSAWQMGVLFPIYGLFYGLTEAAERAWVADFYPQAQRGQAYGWYHATVGLASLPASLLTGWLWHTQGPGAAFGIGAGCAWLAALFLWLCLKPVAAPRV